MNPKVFGIVAILALFAISPARAITYNYSLNGTLAEDSGTGSSLVAYGGTHAPGGGYIFGVQQGLSLSGTGVYDSYSIDVRFYFNDVNVSPPVCCGPFSKPSIGFRAIFSQWVS